MVSGGYSSDCLETFIMPSLKEDLPRIHLPGDVTFSSYKNTFQEFCQKKHLTVPNYKIEAEGNVYRGSVNFSLNHLRCKEVSENMKEAEQRAAFEALQEIGYLKDVLFEVFNTSRKRKSVEEFSGEATKQLRMEDAAVNNVNVITFKGQLNEIAQKRKLPLPTYSTVPLDGGFSATVKFNGYHYESTEVCTKRKAAEQSAAEAALKAFSEIESE